MNNYIVVQSWIDQKHLTAFFVADSEELKKRLEAGDLREGDQVFPISERMVVEKQVPLRLVVQASG